MRVFWLFVVAFVEGVCMLGVGVGLFFFWGGGGMVILCCCLFSSFFFFFFFEGRGCFFWGGGGGGGGWCSLFPRLFCGCLFSFVFNLTLCSIFVCLFCEGGVFVLFLPPVGEI